MTAPSDKRPRNGVRTVLQFAVAGPFIGGAVYLMLGMLSGDAPHTLLRLLIALGASVPFYPFSLVAGVIPAVVTGTLYVAALKAGLISATNYKARFTMAAVVGGLFTAFLMTGFSAIDRFGNLKPDAIHGFLIGAVSGGLCALVFPAAQPKAVI
jgi:hypothetical protein